MKSVVEKKDAASQIATSHLGVISARYPAITVSWIYLAMAVATEVLGLTLMKISVSMGRVEGLILLYVLVALSYYFLAKAVKSISVGVAYAIWEGSGIALITLVSAVVLQQMLTVRELCGLAMVVVGNLMIHAGEVPAVSSVESIAMNR